MLSFPEKKTVRHPQCSPKLHKLREHHRSEDGKDIRQRNEGGLCSYFFTETFLPKGRREVNETQEANLKAQRLKTVLTGVLLVIVLPKKPVCNVPH